MPELVRSALDINGTTQATSADEYYQRQRLLNQQQANNNAQLQAELQDHAAQRALQLQTMGSYADRAKAEMDNQNRLFTHQDTHDTNFFANDLAGKRLTNEGNLADTYAAQAAQMAGLKQQGDWHQQTWDAGAKARELTNANLQDELDARAQFKDMVNGGQPPGNGGGAAPIGPREIFQDLGTNKLVGGAYAPIGVGTSATPPPPAPTANPFGNSGGYVPSSAGAGGTGNGLDDRLAQLMKIGNARSHYLHPELYTADDRLAAQDAITQRNAETEKQDKLLGVLQDSYTAKGDSANAFKVAQQRLGLIQNKGAPINIGQFSDALTQTPAQVEARSTANAATATAGFDFQNTIADIKDLAKKSAWGEVDQNEVLDTAKALVARLVQNQISEPQAKQLIGQQLDAALSGQGGGDGFGNWTRNVAGAIIPGAAGRVIAAPNQLRAALEQAGFPMRQLGK